LPLPVPRAGGGTLVAVTVSCRPDRVDSFARGLPFRRRYL
jgi:hypothetical protein